ncbi:MAG TPA: hypothetical protein VK171_05600 [Fimbriimonas sp.]|nr:hypothetical protein [Fimbriimonas sp.]
MVLLTSLIHGLFGSCFGIVNYGTPYLSSIWESPMGRIPWAIVFSLALLPFVLVGLYKSCRWKLIDKTWLFFLSPFWISVVLTFGHAFTRRSGIGSITEVVETAIGGTFPTMLFTAPVYVLFWGGVWLVDRRKMIREVQKEMILTGNLPSFTGVNDSVNIQEEQVWLNQS